MRDLDLGHPAMQNKFNGNMADRPEPMPRAEHGRWSSYAEKFFSETDHLVQVAGISVGQIKKLKGAGIPTAADLAAASGKNSERLVGKNWRPARHAIPIALKGLRTAWPLYWLP